MSIANQEISFEVEITDNSPEVLAAFDNTIKRALFAIGEAAEGHAKNRIIQEKRVDTGRMLNSIAHQEGDDVVVIGTDVEYAIFQELGTSRGIKPARFLTDAATTHTDEYKGIVQASLENA